uniref:Putative secreted protein n=1 Tax=Anopheles darlingi TaxID=43151 RepID=A0A2M4DB29_ANODA
MLAGWLAGDLVLPFAFRVIPSVFVVPVFFLFLGARASVDRSLHLGERLCLVRPSGTSSTPAPQHRCVKPPACE